MTPESLGIPSGAILRFLDRLERGGVCMHGMMIMRHGKVAAEGYWAPFAPGTPHRLFSVSKSMTSLAIGLLEKEGRLRLDDRICAFFPEYVPDSAPAALQAVTIRDMLRMATCHRTTTYRLVKDDSWAHTFFQYPPTHWPGTVFSYDTSASHTLAALAERLSGMGLLDYLDRKLFRPIGACGEKRWLTDPSGVCQGGTGLVMTLRDLAAVAQLCLEGGRGIVPRDYLEQAVAPQIATPMQAPGEERFGYGYHFWRVRHGYAMYGLGGQLAVCMPDRDALLCTTADTQMDPGGVQKIYDALWQELYPRFGERLPEDAATSAALAKKLDGLAVRPVENHPPYAAAVSGGYAFPESGPGPRHMRIGDGNLTADWGAGGGPLAYGMGEMAYGMFPGTREPCMASAGWIAPRMMRLECHVIGDSPCGAAMLFSFFPGGVTVQMRHSGDAFTARYEGIFSGFAEQGGAAC